MPTLATDLRNQLEAAVIEARNLGEIAGEAALKALAVDRPKPDAHMSEDQKRLRNHLRARARQLGDKLKPNDEHEIRHLAHDCAYEHWHRMLFARFLAENHLLIEPDAGVAITLEECKDLAKDAGTDLWKLAGQCAQKMLPQIFRADDPVLQLPLAREHQNKLERILADLPRAVFTASDALGWCYQFWQTQRKDDVNNSGVKIGADELPAVTQLFTEDYMVDFLLDNTLGAWWAGKFLVANPKLATTAKSEEELRKAVALPGVEWKYLRFIKGDDGSWRPAAGTFDGWPKTAKELKCIDPCCGSGHFVVAMFERLVALRIVEEKLKKQDAAGAVIRDNIHGLEIDPRCTQIAAFNLALAAWKCAGHGPLPSVNIACSGLEVGGTVKDWVGLAPEHGYEVEQIYRVFKNAPALGSLITPQAGTLEIDSATIGRLESAILQSLDRFRLKNDFSGEELGVTAKGLAAAFALLSAEYDLIATNVPFKETKQLAPVIQDFIDSNFAEGRVNLATAFILRIRQMLRKAGTAAMVTPHEWLFLKSYTATRELMLSRSTWHALVDMGESAFESRQAAGAFTALITFTRQTPNAGCAYAGWDVTKLKRPVEKAASLLTQKPLDVQQADQLKNPDARIGLAAASNLPLFSKYAGSYVGLQNGDTPRFVFYFWEVPRLNAMWSAFQLPCDETRPFGGREGALRWEEGRGALAQSELAYIKGREAWHKQGVAIRQTRSLPATRYTGDLYDQSSAVIIPYDPAHLPAVWAYCSSPQFHDDVRRIDKKKNVTNATLVKVPFDLIHWQKVAERTFVRGLPKPHSSDATQWLFDGHPKGSDNPLHAAVARLLGYQWPRQCGAEFHGAPSLPPDGLSKLADVDGIVCIPSVRGEAPAADRLLNLLTAAGVKADRDLDEWLRNEFFLEHCELFYHRPFLWHIWDGRKRDGFHALVNYHKLADGKAGKKLLESLIYSYLGEWISHQKDDMRRGEEGADERLGAAQALEQRLISILEGEPPFDIFVRWKPLGCQPVGWLPDVDDGVRVNIRPFMASDIPNGRAGAGVLRCKPVIGWDRDRGSEPQGAKKDFPWMWAWDGHTTDHLGGSSFDGTRWNACHYSNSVKQQSRTGSK